WPPEASVRPLRGTRCAGAYGQATIRGKYPMLLPPASVPTRPAASSPYGFALAAATGGRSSARDDQLPQRLPAALAETDEIEPRRRGVRERHRPLARSGRRAAASSAPLAALHVEHLERVPPRRGQSERRADFVRRRHPAARERERCRNGRDRRHRHDRAIAQEPHARSSPTVKGIEQRLLAAVEHEAEPGRVIHERVLQTRERARRSLRGDRAPGFAR